MRNTLTVRHTENYDQFSFLEGINRLVKHTRVRKMRQSVLMMGCIRPIVVSKITFLHGVPRYYILDGQHLFQALVGLRKPIPYIEVDINENKDRMIRIITTLNSTSKSWDLYDYVYAWKSFKRNYVQLEQLHQRHGLSYVGIAMLALNMPGRNSVGDLIRGGEFRINNEDFNTMLEYVIELLDLNGLAEMVRVPDRFVAQFIIYYNNIEVYNHETIMQNVTDNIDIIRAAIGDSVDSVLRERIFVLPVEVETES